MNPAAGLLTVLLLCPPARAVDEAPVQRHWAGLSLGESLDEVKSAYPPVLPWRPFREPGGGLVRIILGRKTARSLPEDVEWIRLGLKGGRVEVLQAVYTREASRKKPLGDLVRELSLRFGDPVRRETTYSWRDAHTVLRIFDEEVREGKGKKGVELRTSVELRERFEKEPVR